MRNAKQAADENKMGRRRASVGGGDGAAVAALAAPAKESRTPGEKVDRALKAYLKKTGMRVLDLFHRWDSDSSGAIDKAEFEDAMRRLSHELKQPIPDAEVGAFFAQADRDQVRGWGTAAAPLRMDTRLR